MSSLTFLSAFLIVTRLVSPTSGQTYSPCNPLLDSTCKPNPALGKSVNVDFTSGASDSFTPQGEPKYDSNGASLTVTKGGDAPQLTSRWYIMFGHVDFVLKAAPGTGIVSSALLQSDDLDEIDWEFLGGDDGNVQSNYFGKGLTLTYNRGAMHPAPNNQGGFKTYSIDWTADQIVWSIDGKSVRSQPSSTANEYPYPQTPMAVKVGAWCGGCSDSAGTVEWAGGPANFASGGSTMQVKSISVTDYSTGSQYKYTGTDGTWQSITAIGGSVNPKGGKGSSAAAAAPKVSTSTNGGPMPFQGTHSDKSTTVVQPNAGGWSPTTMQTSVTPTVTTYPGLPEGWTVTSSGKVLPPSAASVTSPLISSSSSPQGSQQDSPAGGYEVVTRYNGQGSPVVMSEAKSEATAVQHYDDKGFLITTRPALASRASPTAGSETLVSSHVEAVAASLSLGGPSISESTTAPTSAGFRFERSTVVLATLFGGLVGLLVL
ncbi:MAG: hypothetical protein Q9217_001950 [Psora testacea]